MKAAEVEPEIRRSLVKILVQSDAPDMDQPWETKGLDSSTGSGFIVETEAGPRILTNAHVLDSAVFVEVRRYGCANRVEARVEGVSDVCDLALLAIDEPGFFDGVPRLELGEVPALGDDIVVMGYPIGGDRLSVTKGIVSRIEMIPYSQSQRFLLAMQIDAAINSGNSGGPVLQDGVVVGVAFEGLDEGENIGYSISVPVIRHFLANAARGNFDPFPDLGVVAQTMESPAHRKFLRIPPEIKGGVLVTGVSFEGSAWGILRPGDVLLELAGVEIAANGTVPFRGGEFLHLSFLVTQLDVGSEIRAKVWRDGAAREVTLPLAPSRPLVRWLRYGERPRYYVFGGLLFAPVTVDYLWSWGDGIGAAPASLRHVYYNELRTPELHEIVVLQQVLADTGNRGYHGLENLIVDRVQGTAIRDLAQLIEIVEGDDAPFVEFGTRAGYSVVVERAVAGERADAVLARFGIPRDRSERT